MSHQPRAGLPSGILRRKESPRLGRPRGCSPFGDDRMWHKTAPLFSAPTTQPGVDEATIGARLSPANRSPRPRGCSPFGDDRMFHTAPLFSDPTTQPLSKCFDKDSAGWANLARGLSHDNTPASLRHRRAFQRGLPPQTQQTRDMSPVPRELSRGFDDEINPAQVGAARRSSESDSMGWAYMRHFSYATDAPELVPERSEPSSGPQDMSRKQFNHDILGLARLADGLRDHTPPPQQTRSRPHARCSEAPWEQQPTEPMGKRMSQYQRSGELRDRSCSPRAPFATEEVHVELTSPRSLEAEVPLRIPRKERSLSPPYGTDANFEPCKPRLRKWEPQMASVMRHSDAESMKLPPQEASPIQIQDAMERAGAAAWQAVERARSDMKTAMDAMDTAKRRLTPERDDGALVAGIAAASALKSVMHGALSNSKCEGVEDWHPPVSPKVPATKVSQQDLSSQASPTVARKVSPRIGKNANRTTSRSQSPSQPQKCRSETAERRPSAVSSRRSSGGSLQWRAIHTSKGHERSRT